MAELEEFVGKAKLYATHIQIDELKKTLNEERKAALLRMFEEIVNIRVSTESAVWGVSEWGQCKFTASDNLYGSIKSELGRANDSKPNNIQDSLIAETSIKNGFTLVTHDRDLFWITTKFDGAVSNIHNVIKELASDIR